MEPSNQNAMLLLAGREKNYAVEFFSVEEICFNIKLSKIPALPNYFLGRGNYKGNTLPIIRLEKEYGQPGEKNMQPVVLILKYQQHQFGLWAEVQPDMIPAGAAAAIQESDFSIEENGIWKEKELYQYDGKLVSLIDVQRSAEQLLLL